MTSAQYSAVPFTAAGSYQFAYKCFVNSTSTADTAELTNLANSTSSGTVTAHPAIVYTNATPTTAALVSANGCTSKAFTMTGGQFRSHTGAAVGTPKNAGLPDNYFEFTWTCGNVPSAPGSYSTPRPATFTFDTGGGVWNLYDGALTTIDTCQVGSPQTSSDCTGTPAHQGATFFDIAGSGATAWANAVPDHFGAGFPTNPCGDLAVSASDSVVVSGDSVTVTFDSTWDSAITSLRIRFRSGDPWQTVPGAPFSADFSQGFIVPTGFDPVTLAIDSAIECVASSLTYWLPVDGTSTPGNAPGARGCTSTSVRWPTQQMWAVGDVGEWVLDVGASAVTVESQVVDPDSPSIGSWTTELASVSNGRFTFEITAGYDGSALQFLLRCTDAVGSVLDGRWSGGVNVLLPGPDCWSTTGLGLHPSSWVPGLLRGLGCMFIPSDESIADLWAVVEESETRVPFVFFTWPMEFALNLFEQLGNFDDVEECGSFGNLGGDQGVDLDSCSTGIGSDELFGGSDLFDMAFGLLAALAMFAIAHKMLTGTS